MGNDKGAQSRKKNVIFGGSIYTQYHAHACTILISQGGVYIGT